MPNMMLSTRPNENIAVYAMMDRGGANNEGAPCLYANWKQWAYKTASVPMKHTEQDDRKRQVPNMMLGVRVEGNRTRQLPDTLIS